MDSSSNSSELYWPKIEIDSENDSPRRDSGQSRLLWSSENTMQLISLLETDCKELWDVKHPLLKDKNARQMRYEYLAMVFNTTADEINRKVHNLRTQFNSELRKLKRHQATGGAAEASGGAGVSGWKYFDALSFLMRAPTDPLENVEGVNLALAEFQADEEEEFAAARAQLASSSTTNTPNPVKTTLRVAASGPPPLPPSAHPMMWPEEPVPRLRPGVNADECQIFGDFVASELRTLRSDESRKKLKRMIQKAILQIGEEEDINIIT